MLCRPKPNSLSDPPPSSRDSAFQNSTYSACEASGLQLPAKRASPAVLPAGPLAVPGPAIVHTVRPYQPGPTQESKMPVVNRGEPQYPTYSRIYPSWMGQSWNAGGSRGRSFKTTSEVKKVHEGKQEEEEILTPTPSATSILPLQGQLCKAKAKKIGLGHVPIDTFIKMSYLDPGNEFKLTPTASMADRQFVSGQGQRLFMGHQMINICTLNTRSLRNYLRTTWGAHFLKRSYDLLGFSEVQSGFKDLYNIPALKTCSNDYTSMFWNSSNRGPEGQNNFGYAVPEEAEYSWLMV